MTVELKLHSVRWERNGGWAARLVLQAVGESPCVWGTEAAAGMGTEGPELRLERPAGTGQDGLADRKAFGLYHKSLGVTEGLTSDLT